MAGLVGVSTEFLYVVLHRADPLHIHDVAQLIDMGHCRFQSLSLTNTGAGRQANHLDMQHRVSVIMKIMVIIMTAVIYVSVIMKIMMGNYDSGHLRLSDNENKVDNYDSGHLRLSVNENKGGNHDSGHLRLSDNENMGHDYDSGHFYSAVSHRQR